MNNEFFLQLSHLYDEINNLELNINNRMFDFVNKASELVTLSNDDYQIEKSLELNKISLKGYVLDSKCCSLLNNDYQINNYSIDELKTYFVQYEQKNNEDCFKYLLALSLYEQIEQIESQVEHKINLELENIKKIIHNINEINNALYEDYEQLYFKFKNQLSNCINSNKLDEKSFNIYIKILNDIFNFYTKGYPTIPDQYLYCDAE